MDVISGVRRVGGYTVDELREIKELADSRRVPSAGGSLILVLAGVAGVVVVFIALVMAWTRIGNW